MVTSAVASCVWESTMKAIELRADCTRCAALCCVAFFFDRSASFAIDKPAGVPCRKLDKHGLCSIYGQRVERGFSGCVGYDCNGAGQRVTQELFGGRDWRDDASLTVPMTVAFGMIARIHRLLTVLAEARRLDLSTTDRIRLQELITALTSGNPLGAGTARLERDATDFLQGLRQYVTD